MPTSLKKMTLEKAKKVLGRLAEGLTDEQIQVELNLSEFLAELALMYYEKQKGSYNGVRNA